MKPALFAADSIGKRFGARVVLNTASIWAREGEVTVLFGRNGCGKSTLLRIGCGMLRPDHGTILFDGERYQRARHSTLDRRGLFFLPDRGLLVPARKLRYHFDALRWYHPHARVDWAVERLALAGLLEHRVRELSGGEQRRAELAIAIARAPKCLVADEPFMGVTPADAEMIGDIFTEVARASCAVLITGHEVPQLMNIADEIVWMAAGTTTGIGNRLDATLHSQFQREYLGRAG